MGQEAGRAHRDLGGSHWPGALMFSSPAWAQQTPPQLLLLLPQGWDKKLPSSKDLQLQTKVSLCTVPGVGCWAFQPRVPAVSPLGEC